MNEVLLRPVRAVVLAMATGLAAVAVLAPAAPAAEPWGFEQVTPVNKGAGAVHPIDTFQTTSDGNGFLLSATSSFAGVPAESVPLYTRYFASRGADGWSHRAMDPPLDPIPPNNVGIVMGVAAVSSDLSHVMVASTRALAPGATPGGGNLYIRNTATGAYTLVATHEHVNFARQFLHIQGEQMGVYVASDGRSAMFQSVVPLVPNAPDGTVTWAVAALYSWTAEDGVRAVSVMPDSEGGGIAATGTAVGGEGDSGIRNALPDGDGLAHVYFSPQVPDDLSGGWKMGPAYVRSGDETKVVSASRIPGDESEPASARVLATGRDGRFMLFYTSEPTPLTEDTPVGGGHFLYRYDAADDSLTYIGTLKPPAKPLIQMSRDGRTVAFTSRLALAPGAPADDPEGPMEENIYVWRDGNLRYVSRADAEGRIAGGAAWLRVLSSNGRYLAFSDESKGPDSAAAKVGFDNVSASCPVVPEPEAGPTPGPCEQVFVFDTEADELTCASCRTDGMTPKGRAGDPDIQVQGMVQLDSRQVQNVANDGTVFFTTPDALVGADANGLNDVYAYRDGEHRLLSRATQGAKARFLDATPDGKSVFIATNDPIAPTDNDKAVDVYLTREGAGFPYTPPIVVPPCTGSDCRDVFTSVEGLPLAGSVSFAGRGNTGSGPAQLSVSRTRPILGVAGSLKVRVPGRGRVMVAGAGVKTVKRSVSRAGTYTVRVALTAKARKALKRSRSARKRVRVTFTPALGSASKRTLSLTYKSKPANGKKKGR